MSRSLGKTVRLGKMTIEQAPVEGRTIEVREGLDETNLEYIEKHKNKLL